MVEQVAAPGGFVPQAAMAFGDRGGAAMPVSWTAGLPIESAAGASIVATIAAGASQSGAIDLDRQRLERVTLPAAWTAAAISFLVSADGASFAPLYDRDGEIVLSAAVVAADRAILVDPAAFFGVRFVKLRSGTAAVPVAQADARTLTLTTVAR